MFTGIIQDCCKILAVKKTHTGVTLMVGSKKIKPKKGDSICVNGACLTVTQIGKGSFEADVIPETLKRTNLGKLARGSMVNLEPSLRASDRLDGAFVLGHVDAIGIVTGLSRDNMSVYMEIQFPESMRPFIAEKGSVTINGVNLTITEVKRAKMKKNAVFSVALIPFTLEHTNLGTLQKGDTVNLEADLIARYLYNFQR